MLNEIGIKAQKASLQIARLDTELKNKILLDMSEELLNNQENILKANSVSYTHLTLPTILRV